jgi:hypothetical protein
MVGFVLVSVVNWFRFCLADKDLVFSGEIVRLEISREDTQVGLADKIGNL